MPAFNHDRTLADGLTDLMRRGVVEAGFDFTCNHCGSVSWFSLDRATQRGECPDCGTRWSGEAEMPWRYRMSSLAKRAVQRSGGAMPVLLTLWRLRLGSKGSFLWQPNLEIYRADHEKGEAPWGELDVICLVDGKFVVGEVKDNINEFSPKDFENVRKVCLALRPDIVVLGFLEGEFNAQARFAEQFQALQSELSSQTKVEWMKAPSSW